MRLLRQLRLLFARPTRPVVAGVFARQTKAWCDARVLVRTYYLVHLLFAAQALGWIERARGAAPSLLWPVTWMRFVGIEVGVVAVHVFSVAAALLAALCPHVRLLRALAWLGFFEAVGFTWSFGKISHSWHAWLWVGLCFVLLPDRALSAIEARRSDRQGVLTVVWLAQALPLLFYSLTGGWKVVGAIMQAARGETHSFSPDALAIQLARVHLMTGSRSALGGFFIDHALLGWPLYLLAIYLELFALLVAFRPALQRPWAICLITAHIVVYLTMRIDFMSQAFLLALLFFRSPFAPQGVAWRDVLRAVPLLGLLWWRRVPDHMKVRFRSCDPPASTVTLTNIST